MNQTRLTSLLAMTAMLAIALPAATSSALPFDIKSKTNGGPGSATGTILNGPSWTFSGNLNKNTKDADSFTGFSRDKIFSPPFQLPVSDAIHAWGNGTFTFSEPIVNPLVYLYRVPNSTQTLIFSFSDQNGSLPADRIEILDGHLTDLGTSVRVEWGATDQGGGGVVQLTGTFTELGFSGASVVGTDLAVVVPEPASLALLLAGTLFLAWVSPALRKGD